MFPQVGEVVGDYRITGSLGAGGMGAVYKVEHVITKRIEAMKLLLSDLTADSEEMQRFVREIQVQARLQHPNIASVYNAFRAGRHFVMVMEYVEGESLQRRLGRGPIPVETGVDYTCQVLKALAFAHAEGVVHRDVTPANIIITPDGSVKLTDFGLARSATDLHVTRSGAPVGSLWYMSPEQVTGSSNVDRRTDIYSVGAVLNEVLTGRKLFDADTAFAVMHAQVETVPSLPSERNREVPQALDEIVLKALAKNPAARFQSADEFRQALEKLYLAEAPVLRRGPFRVSRAVVMMTLVPTALLAGLYSVRLFPHVAGVRALERKLHALPIPFLHSKPAAHGAAQSKSSKPEEHAAETPAAPSEPVTIEEPASTDRPARPVDRPRHGTSQGRRAGGIRVSGGETAELPLPPHAACPTTRVEPVPLAVPAPPVRREAMETAEETAAAPEPTQPSLPAAAEPAKDAKPKKSGNRFLRMLGKIVPIHKPAKE